MRYSSGLQTRSRQTFTRLLDATEALLRERPFEEITVQEIADRAGSSVGSFYTRFADKEALRECLISRYYADMLAVMDRELTADAWRGRSLAERAGAFIDGMVRTCRRRRGLMRMRVLHDIQSTQPMPAAHDAENRQLVSRLEAFFRPCLDEIDHPDPERALSFALRMIDRTAASTVLLSSPRLAAFPEITDAELVRECTRAFLRYLGVRDAAPTEEVDR